MRTKNIEIYFTTSNTWKGAAKIIEVIDRAKFSHVAIKFDDVYEAWACGVRKIKKSQFIETNKIVYTIKFEVDEDDFLHMIRLARFKIGVDYGYKTLFGILYARLFGVKNPFRDQHESFICSEFVAYCLDGYFDLGDFRPEKDGPRRLFELLSNQKEVHLCYTNG